MHPDVLAHALIQYIEDHGTAVLVRDIHAGRHVVSDPACGHRPGTVGVLGRGSCYLAVMQDVVVHRSVLNSQAVLADLGFDVASVNARDWIIDRVCLFILSDGTAGFCPGTANRESWSAISRAEQRSAAVQTTLGPTV